MSDVALRVDGLGKQYRLGRARPGHATLREQIREFLSLRRLLERPWRDDQTPFWALRDVSFEVSSGEVVGIIGRNGAGKSTLLKILARITEPSAGQAEVFGRIGSLLEVGTGFHPELSGRDNIFLNGAVLGMRRSEIVSRFDEIVAFAEVEPFIDAPVKNYSSGMYMRLAFAVAAHLEPEILIIDEVLAVGDAEFQKKCLGKMSEVSRQGRTVLFVSHNMHAVSSLCQRGLVLHHGRVVFDGSAAEGVSRYLEMSQATGGGGATPTAARPGSGAWRFMRAGCAKTVYEANEPKVITFEAAPTRAGAGRAYLSAHLVNSRGTVLSQFDSRLVDVWVSGQAPVAGRLQIDGLWLKPDRYSVDLFLCATTGVIDAFERAAEFSISPALPYHGSAGADATASALVLADFRWSLG